MDKLRAEVVRNIRGQFPHLTLKEIDKVVVAFLNEVKKEVNEGHTVSLSSFGKFSPVDVSRERRFNPIMDRYEDKPVEYIKISFKSSKVWKQTLNGKNNRE